MHTHTQMLNFFFFFLEYWPNLLINKNDWCDCSKCTEVKSDIRFQIYTVLLISIRTERQFAWFTELKPETRTKFYFQLLSKAFGHVSWF